MKETHIEFVQYKTAKSLVISYFRLDYPRMKEENLFKQKTEFKIDFDGEEVYPGTVGDLLKEIRRLGMWGYCDKISKGKTNPLIHYWIGKSSMKNPLKIMELITHEVAHAVGYSSEVTARKIGAIGSFSLSVLDELGIK